mgnify:CR=1 FL=1
MDIALVGAGIGGLAAAACLLQQGHRVRIYEQALEVSEVGAAVQMSANAVKVLYQLGLKETLEQHAVKPESFQFLRHDTGELLHLIVLGDEHEKRHGHPYYQIHRVDLHQGLLHAVLALDPSALVLGKRAASVSETGQGAGIRFEDGRHGVTQRASTAVWKPGSSEGGRFALGRINPCRVANPSGPGSPA